jgi:hypothetical protein
MNFNVFLSASDAMNDSASSTAMNNGMLNSKQGWSNHYGTTPKMSGESLLQQVERVGLRGADFSPSTGIPFNSDAFLSRINGIFESNITNASLQEDLFEPLPLTPQSGHQQQRVRSSSLENCLNLALEHVYAETDDYMFDDFETPCNINNKRCADVAIPTQEPDQKRRRITAPFINNVSGSDDTSPRFHPYQQKQWDYRFQELLAFKKERGHCCVPHSFEEIPILSRWVRAAYWDDEGCFHSRNL